MHSEIYGHFKINTDESGSFGGYRQCRDADRRPDHQSTRDEPHNRKVFQGKTQLEEYCSVIQRGAGEKS